MCIRYALLRHYYFWRCGLFILASLHVAFCCGGSELGKRSFVLYSVVFTVMSLMLAAAVFSLAFRTINPALGIQLEGALLTPDPFACIMGMEPRGGIPCTMLHKTPGIYEAVAAKAAEVKSPLPHPQCTSVPSRALPCARCTHCTH